MHGRLNSFQKTMLQWNEMHPYNAVHVVRVRGTLNPDQLRLGLNTTLERYGLTNLSVNQNEHTFVYHCGPANCEVKIIQCSDDPNLALRAEVEHQLNTPFIQTERFNPFRFFAVLTNDSFFLGLVYFHPVADAESIVFLFRDFVRAYLNERSPEGLVRLNLYPDSRARLLSRHPKVVVRKLSGLPREIRNLKHSHRPRYRDAQDLSNGFDLFSLEPEKLRSLVTAGRSFDVTVNDLLLALLMKSLAPLSRGRVNASKRRNISIGCIVNIRRDLGIDSPQTFGLFLGSFSITHAVPEGISLRELAGDIRRQTLLIKKQQLYLGTPMELCFARFMVRFFSPERQKKFYQKNFPLCGGITNMNLNDLWTQTNDDRPMDYFRGVSTGPVTPLVLSMTTVGDRANVSFNYRLAAFSEDDIKKVKNHFMQQLEGLRPSA